MTKLQSLLDRFYATSIGGRASAMAGDVYFERGLFARAERAWRMAIEHDQVDSELANALQCKRVIALLRAVNPQKALNLYEELAARFDRLPMIVGGRQVEGLSLLADILKAESVETGDHDDSKSAPLTLPGPGSLPVWSLNFYDRASQAKGVINNSNSYYRTPLDLKYLVPPATADKDRIYLSWHSVPFAVDRQTGKIDWYVGSVRETASQLTRRVSTRASDPRNYSLALSNDILLYTKPVASKDNNSYFSLHALNKRTGDLAWSSSQRRDWQVQPDAPEPPVQEAKGCTVESPPEQIDICNETC